MKAASQSPDQVLFMTGVYPSGKHANYAVDLTSFHRIKRKKDCDSHREKRLRVMQSRFFNFPMNNQNKTNHSCPYRANNLATRHFKQPNAYDGRLTHPVTIVFVAERTVNLQLAIAVIQGDGRMVDAVEHIRFHDGIVNHVLEYDAFAYA